MGATLDIQRQEQMERLEQQMLLQRSRDAPRQVNNNNNNNKKLLNYLFIIIVVQRILGRATPNVLLVRKWHGAGDLITIFPTHLTLTVISLNKNIFANEFFLCVVYIYRTETDATATCGGRRAF